MVVDESSTGGTEAELDVTVVLPCLDEAESVGLCVTEALAAFERAGLNGEVVVADNGSSDNSPEIAREAGARVVVETHPGYGSALRCGIRAAHGRVVVMADADYTYPLDRLDELVIPVLDGQADMVLGARLTGATNETMPFLHRVVGTPVLSFLNRRAAPTLEVMDSQSGFRAFDRSAIIALELESTGMEYASEMLISAAQQGLKIDEIHLGYRPRIGDSKLRTFSDGWRHLNLIMFSAPDLMLVWPGAVLTALGIIFTIMGFFAPTGVGVGELTWQPIFFSTILLVVGVQALLGGAILAYESSVVSNHLHKRFSFVGSPRFPSRCLGFGILSTAAGLVIDFILFLSWASKADAPGTALSLAALAQGLVIIGVSVAIIGFVYRMFSTRMSLRRT